MDAAKIMANMKEVLKKTRKKSKSRKTRTKKPSRTDELVNDEAISEILIKNWKFTSPTSLQESSNNVCSPKVNAFERLMSKQWSEPAVNGVKKRKYYKKPKFTKLADEIDDSLLEENKSSLVNTLKSNGDPVVAEDTSSKKRGRADEMIHEATDGIPKTRKTKKAKLVLDSNENSIEQAADYEHCDDLQVDTPKSNSRRPRRACAENINYELLISPEKTTTAAAKPTRKVRRANKDEDSFEIHDVDDDADTKPARKLAPLFVKKIPKPAVDPTVKEARRIFLLSGLPDEIRSSIDKQKQYEDEIFSNELVSFPSISHVAQLRLNEDDYIEQDLKASRVIIRNNDEVEVELIPKPLKLGILTECRNSEGIVQKSHAEIDLVVRDPLQNDYLKTRVKQLKETFGSFPTNRCFKQLYWMFQNAGTREAELDHNLMTDTESVSKTEENLMFVNIFKPTRMKHFVVNVEPIKQLQNFLLAWNDKTDSYDSDDSSSRTSTKGTNNFVVLSGPNGSGKTVSVYALANELNYQVIEINAGTRRSGKKLLESLLEATQSHRVRDKTGKLMSFEDEASLGDNICDAAGAKSIILIEDAELAFESDDGFVSSIQQLINISKRPVILTTNNRDCQHLQKFIQLNEIAFVTGHDSSDLSKYLTLLCLAVGYELETNAIERLLASNEYDMRKTINEIEFFVRGENSKSTSREDLLKIFNRPSYSNVRQLSCSGKSLGELTFESSLASTTATIYSNDYNDASYQQQQLTNEIGSYLSAKCGLSFDERCPVSYMQNNIERLISSEMFPQLTRSKAQAMDYSPVLRSICRSEELRGQSGRRAANSHGRHYLRFLVAQNVLDTKYLNEQCEILQ